MESTSPIPPELSLTVDDRRWLLHIGPSVFVRLLMGHVAVDGAAEEPGFESSTGTALDAARVLFPARPVWRSPLDSATA